MSGSAQTFTPLHKTVTVPWSRERAFTRFTTEIGSWWPLATHSVGGAQTERCVFEGRVGGQIYEETRNGARHLWGTVLEWEPALPRGVHLAPGSHAGDGPEHRGSLHLRGQWDST